MRNIIAIVAFLFLSTQVFAEDTTIAVAYDAGYAPVGKTIDVEAEYVALKLSIVSTSKSELERLKQTQKLLSTIRLAVTKNLNFEFQIADESSAPVDMSSVTPPFESSSYYLLTDLDPKEDIYSATQDLLNFIKQINVPAKMTITTKQVGLAMSSPEKYRDQLLHLIKKDIEKTKDLLDSNSVVTVTGLENPVYLRRKNDKKVTLFLDYKISLGL